MIVTAPGVDTATQARLRAESVRLAYDGRMVVDGLSFAVPDGLVTAVVGPNACGKSTLLRALSRLLQPTSGVVVLDGEQIHRLPTKEVARRLGLLPQTPIAPEALAATGITGLADRPVDQLSGGQRQRVWIAMAIAQQTELLLLDEPTTFLDIAHQVEVLELVARLNREQGRTIVLVLHDLNLACRYADHIVAMRDGAVVASGDPGDVIPAESVRQVFGLDCVVIEDPVSGAPLVIPAAPSACR